MSNRSVEGGSAQPVYITNTSLPVTVNAVITGGDASAANQVTGNNSLASIDSKLPALVGGAVPVTVTGTAPPTSAGSLPSMEASELLPVT